MPGTNRFLKKIAHGEVHKVILNRKLFLCSTSFLALFAVGCSEQTAETTELKHYPIDSTEGVIAKSGIQFDNEVTADGNGSLRITASSPTTVRLYETGDMDIENSRLIYRAKLRSEDVEGQVYIEMLCNFPQKGEFFSRALQSPLTGTREWRVQETPFFLKAGENPDNVKINLVVNGTGKVWIDDIRLLKAPLE
jgi:hypothetical protein